MGGETKQLEQTLIFCALMVGCKPEKIEIDIIVKWLIKHHPQLSIGEIANAFEINLTNRFWEMKKPFGSFNCMFVSDIIIEFNKYKQNKIKTELNKLPQHKKELISYEEAKPMLDKMAKRLRKINNKFSINNKKAK